MKVLAFAGRVVRACAAIAVAAVVCVAAFALTYELAYIIAAERRL